MGFTSVTEYAEFLAGHPDKLDILALLLTAMLNCIHLCVQHKRGAWHTHTWGKCVCVLQLAYMGENTYIALEKEKTPDESHPPPQLDAELNNDHKDPEESHPLCNWMLNWTMTMRIQKSHTPLPNQTNLLQWMQTCHSSLPKLPLQHLLFLCSRMIIFAG